MSYDEIISIHTKTPKVENVYSSIDQLKCYKDGIINLLSIIEMKTDILCCKYTKDFKKLAAGFEDGSIIIFNSMDGEYAGILVDDEIRSYPAAVTAIKHRPRRYFHPTTDRLISSYVNGCVKCWNLQTKKPSYTIREKRQTLGLSYHTRNNKFVTYGDDAKLNVYDEESQTLERSFFGSSTGDTEDGHTSNIFGCAIHPKSNHELVSGGWDGRIMCWDDRQPYATKSFSGVHICGESIDFDQSGKTILTCSWRKNDNIQLWDYGTCKLIENILPYGVQSRLYCAKFMPNSNYFICGGTDANLVCLIDVKHKKMFTIKNNPGGILSLDLGTVRRKNNKSNIHTDISKTPRISFVTGKQINTVDFG